MDTKKIGLLTIAIVLVAGGAIFYLATPFQRDETELRSQLSKFGVLATLGGNGRQIASVNFSTIKDKSNFENAFDVVAKLGALTSLILDKMPVDASDLHRLNGIRSLASISLSGCDIASEEVKQVANLRGLQSLNLSGTGVGDDDLPMLGRLTELSAIDLSDTQVENRLSPLAGLPNLKLLVLSGVSLADGALAELSSSSSLTRVSLGRSQYSERDLAALQEAKPSLVIDR